jgi:hypothetical protein
VKSVVECISAVKAKRGYLQFSLGTMFLAIAALCIWLGVQARWIENRRVAREWLEAHDCDILDEDFFFLFTGHRGFTYTAPWSIRILDERGVFQVNLNETTLSPDELKSAERKMRILFPEGKLSTTF